MGPDDRIVRWYPSYPVLYPPTDGRGTLETTSMKSVYVIGSLRNKNIPTVAESLRSTGLDVFDDWYSAGPEADDYLRDYYRGRGLSYSEVLNSYAAKHIFEFDRYHLERCDCAVLVLPAGKSGHLELGYVIGLGKPGYILMDGEPERVDIMHQFATIVTPDLSYIIEDINDRFNISG